MRHEYTEQYEKDRLLTVWGSVIILACASGCSYVKERKTETSGNAAEAPDRKSCF